MTYQRDVGEWMLACFGPAISHDKIERNFRFFEEALELVQAHGCTKEQALTLVDYVFSRPIGEPAQEVGGVMVCLAALCNASGLDMDAAGCAELTRVWQNIEKIRAKHAAKSTDIRHAPLPGYAA